MKVMDILVANDGGLDKVGTLFVEARVNVDAS